MSNYSNDGRGRSRRRSPTPDRHGQIILLPQDVDATLPRGGWSPPRSFRRRSVASEGKYSHETQPIVVLRRVSPRRSNASSPRAELLSLPVETWQQRPRSASSRLPSECRPTIDSFGDQRPRYQSSDNSSCGTSISRGYHRPLGASHWFRHRSLSRPRGQFRLIKVLPYESGSPIRCNIQHLNRVDGSLSWTAVSYAWGDERAQEPILLSDAYKQKSPRPIQVTRNLHDILSHLAKMRRSHRHEKRWTGWFWIDALCIIQDDEHPEKDIQIKFMPKIYGGAHEVIAWIGPGDSVTDEAMRYIRNQPSTFLRAVTEGTAEARLDSFEDTFRGVAFCVRDIFSKSYWGRLWILQELAMAKNTTIVCGKEELPWKIFIDFATQVAAADFGPSKTLRQAQGEIAAKQPVWLLTLIHEKRTRGLNLAELVFLSKDSVCGRDKKDYIRALLGMVQEGSGWRLDPEEHRSACSMLSHATRVMIWDMRYDPKISPTIRQRCEKLARLAHHDPLVEGAAMERIRQSCFAYKQALFDCREIASVLYEHRVLFSRRIGRVGETWDFEEHGMRRRRSHSRSRSRSRSRDGRSMSRSRGRHRNLNGDGDRAGCCVL